MSQRRPDYDAYRAREKAQEVSGYDDGSCCTPDSGQCCGPGSWCCKRAGKHEHDEEDK